MEGKTRFDSGWKVELLELEGREGDRGSGRRFQVFQVQAAEDGPQAPVAEAFSVCRMERKTPIDSGLKVESLELEEGERVRGAGRRLQVFQVQAAKDGQEGLQHMQQSEEKTEEQRAKLGHVDVLSVASLGQF